MKLIAVLFIFSSCFSFAASRVGEWAAYDYEETTNKSTRKGVLLKEVVEEKNFPANSPQPGKYVRVSEKFIFGSENKEVFKWVLEKDFLSPFNLNRLLFKCRFSKSFGEIEKIKVKAGQFTTCRPNAYSTDSSDTWIGVVPFQIILSIQSDGIIFRRSELISYGWKKKSSSLSQ